MALQYAKPDRAAALQAVIRDLAKSSREEPGCVEYSVYTDKDQPNIFVFQETWATQGDLDRHVRSAAFQAFWSCRMDYLECDVAIHFLTEFV
jgi:quinol monooxygenase YgiN